MANNSVRGLMIDTRRGMVILDSEGMPINLGRSGYEDNPEAPLPVLPFAARNVIPTPLGYQSAFRPSPLYNQSDDVENPVLKNLLFQDIFNYQTINMYNITVGLAEGGLYLFDHGLTAPTTGGTSIINKWTRVQIVPEFPGIKTLWTRCTLDNKVYIYHQAAPEVYTICDLAEYNEAIAAGARSIWFSTVYQFGVVAQVPTFLNMEGQLGIFKADNRLGFWDTDGAIAWSSALNKLDFKPDVTTFAGVTKFSTVSGNISSIHQHGRGFIIYAASSITLVTPTTSQERWSGNPILSAIGVLYETQVAVSQPDTVHFCWTTAGLYIISNGQAAVYEPELSNYVRSICPLIQLRVINGSHLYVQISTPEILDSGASRFARMTYDGQGTPFAINRNYVPGDSEYEGSMTWPYHLLYGMEGRDPDLDLEDFEPIPDVIMPNPLQQETLIPCYTGWKFMLPPELVDDLEELKWDPDSEVPLNVTSWPGLPGWAFPEDNTSYDFLSGSTRTSITPNPTFFSYDAGPIVSPPGARFIDQAGPDFQEILEKSMMDSIGLANRFDTLLRLGVATGSLITPPDPLNDEIYLRLIVGVNPPPYAGYPLPVPLRPDPYPIQSLPFGGVTIPNVIVKLDWEVEDDGCILKIIAKVVDYQIGDNLRGEILDEQTEPQPGYEDTQYRYNDFDSGNFFYSVRVQGDLVEVPGSQKDVILFQCEISGYGYFPYGGFSFRKTHSRSIFKVCSPTSTGRSTFTPDAILPAIETFVPTTELEDESFDPSGTGYLPDRFEDYSSTFSYYTVESTMGYPDSFPTYANFGKGIFSPYYPAFIKAYVKDLALEKWGVFSTVHSLLFDVTPANRSDSMRFENPDHKPAFNLGAIPNYGSEDMDMYPFLWPLTGKPCVMNVGNSDSEIHYGRIGTARAGFTRVVGGSFSVDTYNIDSGGSCQVTVAGSLTNMDLTIANGSTPGNSVTFGLSTIGQSEVPFTLEGRWYTIALRGNFTIRGLALYGKPSGRLRFPLAERPPQ